MLSSDREAAMASRRSARSVARSSEPRAKATRAPCEASPSGSTAMSLASGRCSTSRSPACRRTGLLPSAREQRVADCLDQLLLFQRLGEEAVDSYLVAPGIGFFVPASGNDDDRDFLGRRIRAQSLEHLKAAQIGKVEVEQD